MKSKLIIVAVLALIANTTHGATIHVDIANCPGPGDGSIGDPFCSIQTAIDLSLDGDEVLVAPGTYVEDVKLAGKSSLALRSTDGAEATIIDGDGQLPAVTCLSLVNTVIDGFTITNGGGGRGLSTGTGVTVMNCIIAGNLFTGGGSGGGVYIQGSWPVLVLSCVITGNVVSGTGAKGAGVYVSANTNVAIVDTVISSNTALGNAKGGGVAGSDAVLSGCTIRFNNAATGPAVWSENEAPLTITDTLICTNWGNPLPVSGVFFDGGGNTIVEKCPTECAVNQCRSDSNDDGVVDIIDFLTLLADWGPCP